MAIINIYSKRQRKIRGEVNDVYQYNNIPHALRVQIIKIITDSIGFPSSNERYTSYRNEADKVYAYWICPYISRHLLSLNPLQARCRRYSRGER